MSGRLRDGVTVATVAVALAGGCAPLSLADRAMRARGGPVGAVIVVADAEVRRGYPGTWQWRRVFAPPDRYAWTIATTGEPLHYTFDGGVVRAFVGGTLSSVDASPAAPLRSQARFIAVALLDALGMPGVRVVPMAAQVLPPGVEAGLTLVFPGEEDRYTIFLDDRLRPVRVEGPVDLSPVGRGTLVARQDDFHSVAGVTLPHHVVWELDGTELADERACAVCVRAEPLPAGAFADPSGLPDCPVSGR